MPFTYDDIQFNTVGQPVSVSPLLTTWRDMVRITNVDMTPPLPDDDFGLNPMVDVYTLAPGIPNPGDQHPVYSNPAAFCLDVALDNAPSTSGKSGHDFDIMVAWVQQSLDSNGYPINKKYFDTYQSTEIRNYDATGKLTIVQYTPTNAQNIALPQHRATDIRVPRVTHGLRIVQYENFQGSTLADIADIGTGLNSKAKNADFDDFTLPFYNTLPWGGFLAGQVLYIGRQASNEGIPLYLMTYNFLINDRGWDKWEAAFTLNSGLVPNDIADLDPNTLRAGLPIPNPLPNGIGVFDILDDLDFNDAFSGLNID